MTKLTMLPVKKTTRERIKTFGIKGETYDEIINRLLDEKEEQEK